MNLTVSSGRHPVLAMLGKTAGFLPATLLRMTFLRTTERSPGSTGCAMAAM
nr:hypothetical protein [Streptomyces lavendulae]